MKGFFIGVTILLLLPSSPGTAESRLRLKSMSQRASDWMAAMTWPVKRRTFTKSHVLVHFEGAPTPTQIRELERRGARLLQYVPDSGLLVSLNDGADLKGLGLRWAGHLREADKVSRLLRTDQAGPADEFFLAEFYPDVDPSVARALAREQGFAVAGHPDLLPNQLLLRGPAARLSALAEWDEVSYVFPASEDLAAGHRVHACAGAITTLGPVGQYAARISEGWDGPGRQSAELGYFFERLTQQLPEEQVRQEIRRAMSEWAAYASLSFLPAIASTGARTLDILFAGGNHGDPFPFDGRSGVLAHTFYPAPPNPEPIAGDIHFDDDEEWVTGSDKTIYSVDLFTVALHEIGHALGLGHSDQPGTVMYPYYRRAAGLTQSDIASIQELYAPPASPPIDNPHSGGEPADPPSSPPLSLLIQSPPVFPFTTAMPTVSLSGIAAGGLGDVQVTWVSDGGAGGIAQGGRTWSVPALPLQPGDNNLTITATDESRRQVFRSIVITRRTEQNTPGTGSDTVAPAVKILSPAMTSVLSYSSAIRLQGTAMDNVGVIRVEWTTSTGKAGLASGTSSWTTGEIPLLVGTNRIVVRASDAAGNTGWRSVTVTRR